MALTVKRIEGDKILVRIECPFVNCEMVDGELNYWNVKNPDHSLPISRNKTQPSYRNKASILARVISVFTFGVVSIHLPQTPGSWAADMINIATFGKIKPCLSCQKRAYRMDRAGWKGLPKLCYAWASSKW